MGTWEHKKRKKMTVRIPLWNPNVIERKEGEKYPPNPSSFGSKKKMAKLTKSGSQKKRMVDINKIPNRGRIVTTWMGD